MFQLVVHNIYFYRLDLVSNIYNLHLYIYYLYQTQLSNVILTIICTCFDTQTRTNICACKKINFLCGCYCYILQIWMWLYPIYMNTDDLIKTSIAISNFEKISFHKHLNHTPYFIAIDVSIQSIHIFRNNTIQSITYPNLSTIGLT